MVASRSLFAIRQEIVIHVRSPSVAFFADYVPTATRIVIVAARENAPLPRASRRASRDREAAKNTNAADMERRTARRNFFAGLANC